MRNVNVKTILLVAGFIATAFLGGCTDWEKKYSALNVEHQNTMGLLDREKTEKGQLAEQVAQGQQTIEELQKQIKEGRSTKSGPDTSGRWIRRSWPALPSGTWPGR